LPEDSGQQESSEQPAGEDPREYRHAVMLVPGTR
jgi:hypothetical protein